MVDTTNTLTALLLSLARAEGAGGATAYKNQLLTLAKMADERQIEPTEVKDVYLACHAARYAAAKEAGNPKAKAWETTPTGKSLSSQVSKWSAVAAVGMYGRVVAGLTDAFRETMAEATGQQIIRAATTFRDAAARKRTDDADGITECLHEAMIDALDTAKAPKGAQEVVEAAYKALRKACDPHFTDGLLGRVTSPEYSAVLDAMDALLASVTVTIDDMV